MNVFKIYFILINNSTKWNSYTSESLQKTVIEYVYNLLILGKKFTLYVFFSERVKFVLCITALW